MVGRLSIVKMALLSKAIWISNAIPTKILMASFFGGGGMEKPILKFIWNCKRP